MKFRKKPAVIEAEQWDGTGAHGAKLWDKYLGIGLGRNGVHGFFITTASGEVKMQPGDWLCVQVVNGKTDVWKVAPEIFAATYEPAD